MKPLREFTMHMMGHYPFEGPIADHDVVRDDFGLIGELMMDGRNPSSVLRSVNDVRSAKQRSILATFGALPQGRRLLDMSETHAKRTLESLKHISKLDGVASKAHALKDLCTMCAAADDLNAVVDALVQLLDEFTSVKRECAEHDDAGEGDGGSYAKTLSEAQDGLADLVQVCTERQFILEGKPWILAQVDSLKTAHVMNPLPDFKIGCLSNLSTNFLKQLGRPLAEVPDLLGLYTHIRAMVTSLDTVAKARLLAQAGTDGIDAQRTAATRACAALQEFVTSSKAFTTSFRLHHDAIDARLTNFYDA